MFKKDEVGGETIIASGVRVEGDFTSRGKVVIDGEVMGNIKTEDDIHVGEQAKIVANVQARNAVVSGEIKGNVRIQDRMDITSSARIKGDITATIFSVEAGAILNGKCCIGEKSTEKKQFVTKQLKTDVPTAEDEGEEKA